MQEQVIKDIEGYNELDKKQEGTKQITYPDEIMQKLKKYTVSGYYEEMNKRAKYAVRGATVGVLVGIVYAMYFQKRLLPYGFIGGFFGGMIGRFLVIPKK